MNAWCHFYRTVEQMLFVKMYPAPTSVYATKVGVVMKYFASILSVWKYLFIDLISFAWFRISFSILSTLVCA